MRTGVQLRPDLMLVARQVQDGSRVLDLGCGYGELLAYLMASKLCSGTGVERDPQGVLSAIRQGVPLIELDIDTQLAQFGDDSYDVVVLSRTLQAVLQPRNVLEEMARIGKRLIVTMPNFGYWRHRLTLLGGHMPQSRDLPFTWYETPNLHHATLIDLEGFFTGIGLSIQKRIPLDDAGRPMSLGQRAANLRASSAIYVLNSPPR